MILFISGVLSQTAQEPFATEKEGKVYYIKAVSDAPNIDGILDDAIWSSILPITDFVQEDPDNRQNQRRTQKCISLMMIGPFM